MKNVCCGIGALMAIVGCGGVAMTSNGHVGTDDEGRDAEIDPGQDSGIAHGQHVSIESGQDTGVDTSAPAPPTSACNVSTLNRWQKSPGASSSSYPGVYATSSLTLGGDVISTAGVVRSEFVIAPLPAALEISLDAYWQHDSSMNTWRREAACVSEIYLPFGASNALPWVLVSATGPSCNLASMGIWYPTSPSNPSYAQIPPFNDTDTPTSFAVDSSGRVYTTGGSGASCSTGSGIPYGPCIQAYDGETWSTLPDAPGAEQVTSGSDDTQLFALDQNHGIWFTSYPASSWSEISVTSLCGGGTLEADLIAANSGFVYAINDAGGGAGNVYMLSLGLGSSCWSALDTSVQMMSISANPQLDGVSALLGTDSSNGLWYFCNGNTPP